MRMLCGLSPSPNLGLSGMLQGSEPDLRSLRAHLGRMMPCAYGPFGDMWARGPRAFSLWPRCLLETASSPHCPLTWVLFLIVWGRAPPLILPDCARAWAPHHLLSRAVKTPARSLSPWASPLLGHGKSLSLHIADHVLRESGGMVMQRGQGRGGLSPSWVP